MLDEPIKATLMKLTNLSAMALVASTLTVLPVTATTSPAEAYGRYHRSYGFRLGHSRSYFTPSYYGYRGFSRGATFGGYRYGHLRGGLGISLRSGR